MLTGWNFIGYFHEVCSIDVGPLSCGSDYESMNEDRSRRTRMDYVCYSHSVLATRNDSDSLWSNKARLLGTSEICAANKLDVESALSAILRIWHNRVWKADYLRRLKGLQTH
jgi:hypothetical protein